MSDKTPQRDLIVACAAEVEFWHDADGAGYATVAVRDHHEHYRIRSKSFRDWLGYRFYKKHDGAPSAQAMQDALAVLGAKARFDCEQFIPAIRIGHHGGTVYLDLADADWRSVEITHAGWQVVGSAPVRFIRPRGLRQLPAPVAGGDLQELERFLNVETEGDLKLILGWLVMAFSPRGPYPILVLNGEQGAAKSTTARALRSIVDPSEAPLRSPPREERDMLVAARNGWVIALDNLSNVKEWQADALCRIATGGGYAARALYTDSDEILFEAMRPVILNGIPDLASRPDLADRALILKLPNIDRTKRRPEVAFWCDFDEAAGRILAFMLDAVSTALARRDDITLQEVPRMGDFAIWAEAAGKAFGWRPGEFTAAYRDNRAAAVGQTVSADVVAEAILTLVTEAGEWEGTATEMLETLEARVSDQVRRSSDWPKAPNKMSGRLRRAAPGLRAMGLDVIEHPRAKGGIRWTLRMPVQAIGGIGEGRGNGADGGDAGDGSSDISDRLQAHSSSNGQADHGDIEERLAITEIDGDIEPRLNEKGAIR